MKTMREMNRLLISAIRNVMTDEQLDKPLADGTTTRQLMVESSLIHTTILPDEDKVLARPAATNSPVKAYWHHHGYICPTKPNAEWVPLVVQF